MAIFSPYISFVEYHLWSSSPNLLFLIAAQVSSDVCVGSVFCGRYFLLSPSVLVSAKFRSVTYVARLSHLSLLSLIFPHSCFLFSLLLKYSVCIYCSPNSLDYSEMFYYLIVKTLKLRLSLLLFRLSSWEIKCPPGKLASVVFYCSSRRSSP